MDTTVWGPLFWNLITEVSKVVDSINPAPNQDEICTLNNVQVLLNSLTHVFPCIHCRQFYSSQIHELKIDEFIQKRSMLQWNWILKNRVLEKLNQPQTLTFEKFIKRVNVYQTCLSITQIWDLLYLIAIDLEIERPEEEVTEQIAWLKLFLVSMINVFLVVPDKMRLALHLHSIDWQNFNFETENAFFYQLWNLQCLSDPDFASREPDWMKVKERYSLGSVSYWKKVTQGISFNLIPIQATS